MGAIVWHSTMNETIIDKAKKIDFYESPFEFLGHLKSAKVNPNATSAHKKRSMRADSWNGKTTHEMAVEMAGNGWHDAPKLSDTGIAHSLRDFAQGQREGTVASVSGAFLDIGAYVSGEPECFQDFAPVETPRGIVLGVNFGALANVSAQEMINRGTALMAIVDELQRAGFTVSLEAFWYSHSPTKGYEFTLKIPIKKAGDRVDENQIAFWSCHPAALRQLGFAWQEIQDDKWVQIMDVCGGRGISLTPKSLEGVDYIFGSEGLPRDEKQTLEYYAKCMGEIEKVLAK